MAAAKLGLKEVPCIELVGLTEAQKKAYVITDNQLALTSGWDLDILKLEIESLDEMDFDIDLLGFEDDFLSGFLNVDIAEGLTDEDGPYSDKSDGLTYEPSSQIPAVSDVYSGDKVASLTEKIAASSVSDENKAFLFAAATRHYKFNYKFVADLYSHADTELQSLMEESALVILDYDRAVELGYAKLREVLKDDFR